MIVKVCGLRDDENIQEVVELGVDWIGFIFYPKSPRMVSMIPTHAGIIPDKGDLTTTSKTMVKRVGVFVDDMPQNIITRAVNYQLDILQLHGNESATLIRNLRNTIDPDLRQGIKVMKAISLPTETTDAFDIEAATRPYLDCVDYFLFDTASSTVGGSGRKYNWQLLEAYNGNVPFLLSGGIGPDDVAALKAFHHPQFLGIDLNSRFESEPGVKDIHKLKAFLDQL